MQKHFEFGGYDFYVCMGRHDHGYYIAIPNWNVCVEADEPENWRYNAQQLGCVDDLPVGSLAVAENATEIAKAIADEWGCN